MVPGPGGALVLCHNPDGGQLGLARDGGHPAMPRLGNVPLRNGCRSVTEGTEAQTVEVACC